MAPETAMGWLANSGYDQMKSKALSLTPEQRAALTWGDVLKFCPADTLLMAAAGGMVNRKLGTPWESVCRLNGLDHAGTTRATDTVGQYLPG
jgi:hypothetical protein